MPENATEQQKNDHEHALKGDRKKDDNVHVVHEVTDNSNETRENESANEEFVDVDEELRDS